MITDKTQPIHPDMNSIANSYAYKIQYEVEHKIYAKHKLEGWLLDEDEIGYTTSQSDSPLYYLSKYGRRILFLDNTCSSSEISLFTSVLRKKLEDAGFFNVNVQYELVEDEEVTRTKRGFWGDKQIVEKSGRNGYIVFFHIEW